MASYNKVLLMGNLTRDPQLKYLPSQTPVVEFGIACNRKYKTATGEQREEVTFVDCAAFARTAEVINQYFTKGKPIFIEGRLKFDSWEDKQGGGKRSKLSVHIDSFQFIGGDREGGGPAGGGGAGGFEQSGGGEYDAPPRRSAPPQRGPAAGGGRPAPQQAPTPEYSDERQISDDDIPF